MLCLLTKKAAQLSVAIVICITLLPNAAAQSSSDPPVIVAEVLITSPLDEVARSNSEGVRELVQNEQIPQALNGSFVLPKLSAPSTTQNLERMKQLPKDFRDKQTVPRVDLPESGTEREAGWEWTEIEWEAANTYSHPRYFEDRMLERHGHQTLGKLQPLASGVRFFTAIPMLPYLTAVSEPGEKEYSLGYYRSGNAVPALRQRPPYERRAVLSETAVLSGFFMLVP